VLGGSVCHGCGDWLADWRELWGGVKWLRACFLLLGGATSRDWLLCAAGVSVNSVRCMGMVGCLVSTPGGCFGRVIAPFFACNLDCGRRECSPVVSAARCELGLAARMLPGEG